MQLTGSFPNRLRLQVFADAPVVVAVPIFEEVRLGVEILTRKSERGPERLSTGLVATVLITLNHDASISSMIASKAASRDLVKPGQLEC